MFLICNDCGVLFDTHVLGRPCPCCGKNSGFEIYDEED